MLQKPFRTRFSEGFILHQNLNHPTLRAPLRWRGILTIAVKHNMCLHFVVGTVLMRISNDQNMHKGDISLQTRLSEYSPPLDYRVDTTVK